MPLLFGDFFKLVLEFLLFGASGFMILLVLVQRGRGGGLTGALGGMGGQSAFGAKAGDVFTRITVVSAIIWIFLCLITIRSYTYVNVNTTAMKEYQYTKLLVDDSIGFGNEQDASSSLNLGRNPDDGPGATMSSKDSADDKKEAEQDEKKSSDDANGAKTNDDNAKSSKGDDSAPKGSGESVPEKGENGKNVDDKNKDDKNKDANKSPEPNTSKKTQDDQDKGVAPKGPEKKASPDKSK